jgi:hypothetical protein
MPLLCQDDHMKICHPSALNSLAAKMVIEALPLLANLHYTISRL